MFCYTFWEESLDSIFWSLKFSLRPAQSVAAASSSALARALALLLLSPWGCSVSAPPAPRVSLGLPHWGLPKVGAVLWSTCA